MKTEFKATVPCCIAMLLFFSSCIHYYYQPGANNVPLFKEKNEARIQIQSSGGNNLSGFDAQTAYAVGDHTGLQLNFFHAGAKEEGYGIGRGNYIEAAAGYFKAFSNNRLVFETYGGLGYGSVTNVYGSSDFYGGESSKFGILKLFAQPSFGFTHKNFSVALSSKFAVASFHLASSSVTKENNPYDVEDIKSLDNKSFFLWEPGFMIRGGFEHFQLLVQVTKTAYTSGALPADNINGSIGIVVPFKINGKSH